MNDPDPMAQRHCEGNYSTDEDVPRRCEDAGRFVIGQSHPMNAGGICSIAQRFEVALVPQVSWFLEAYEMDAVVDREYFEVGKDLTLAQRFKQPIIANIQRVQLFGHNLAS